MTQELSHKKYAFSLIEIEWKLAEDYKEYFDCLYCVYGDSPIYGRDVLLYIGLTKNLLDKRKKEHEKADQFDRINNRKYRVGKIINWGEFENQKDKLLKIAESILICMLKPSYNSQNLKDIWEELTRNKTNFYLILNKNDRGALPLEVSNIWWKD